MSRLKQNAGKATSWIKPGITIEDDGPGCSDKAMWQLTQRGIRINESIKKNVAGHGLGLAIVHDIVAAYDGEISFKPSTMGGLAVAVTLTWHGREKW